jgi:hypothetical protein
MEFIKITGFTLIAGMAYGILHDQVTARICVEYFTIAHAPLFPTTSPFWLAVFWGIVATWWVALPLGLLLACAARIGAPAKLTLRDLRQWILCLLAGMAVLAFAAGVIGAWRAGQGDVALAQRFGIPEDRQIGFMADAWAHEASYLGGIVGGLVLIVHVGLHRMRSARRAAQPAS